MFSTYRKNRLWLALAAALMAAGLLWAWSLARGPAQRRPGRLVQAKAAVAGPLTEGWTWAS